MIVVRIELHSAITGEVSEIGRMNIANTGSGSAKRGNYAVQVMHRGCITEGWIPSGVGGVQRRGEVLDYPRLSYNVWRLVLRALRSAFPEEK